MFKYLAALVLACASYAQITTFPGGGGSVGPAGPTGPTGPAGSGSAGLRITRTSGTVLGISAGYCQVGTVTYTHAAATVTLSGASAAATTRIYCDENGVLTAGHDGATTATCNANCTVATGISANPATAVMLGTATYTAAAWDVSGITQPSIDARRDIIDVGNGLQAVVSGSGKMTISSTISQTFSTLTDGATITWAMDSGQFLNAVVTLGGNRTINITNPVNGGSYVLKVIQDGAGSRTLTAGTGCTWLMAAGDAGGTFPLGTAIGAVTVIAFTYDGTNCLTTVGASYSAL